MDLDQDVSDDVRKAIGALETSIKTRIWYQVISINPSPGPFLTITRSPGPFLTIDPSPGPFLTINPSPGPFPASREGVSASPETSPPCLQGGAGGGLIAAPGVG